MKKQQVIEKIETAWQAFTQAHAGLTDAHMLLPGVTGEWSVRDLLAHVTWWEQETLKYLPVILRGERLPRYADLFGSLDDFNARMTRERQSLTLAQVRAEHITAHQQLLDYLQSLPDEVFQSNERFLRRLRFDTYKHYPEHTKAILAWRETQLENSKSEG